MVSYLATLTHFSRISRVGYVLPLLSGAALTTQRLSRWNLGFWVGGVEVEFARRHWLALLADFNRSGWIQIVGVLQRRSSALLFLCTDAYQPCEAHGPKFPTLK